MTSSAVYQPITLNANNAVSGQKIAVLLISGSTAQIAFSSGPEFQNTAGIQVMSQSGTLPLAQLNMTSSQLTVLTSSSGGGGSLSFQVGAYLAADPSVQMLYLQSLSDPGVQITASIGNGMPQVVNQTATLFSWHPT